MGSLTVRRATSVARHDLRDVTPQPAQRNGHLVSDGQRADGQSIAADTRGYRIWDDSSPERRKALKDDIASRGPLDPVEVDDDGVIIVGQEQAEICSELGIHPVVVMRSGWTETQKVEHAVKAVTLAHHPGPLERARAIRRAAELMGTTLGSKGGPAGNRPTVGQLVSWFGLSHSAMYRLLDQEQRLAPYPDLVEQVESGKTRINKALQAAGRREACDRRILVPDAIPRLTDLRLGSFTSVLRHIAAGSVDLLLTDPPYNREGIHWFGDLAAFAALVLKRSGILVAEAGLTYFDEEIALLGEHLKYRWMIRVDLPGATNHQYAPRAINGWRPLLVYCPPDAQHPKRWIRDTYEVEGPQDKTYHDWQKSVELASLLIEDLTDPGDLVVDPFVGSGTTAIACMRLDRRFIGAEIDPDTWRVAMARIADEAAR